MPDDDVSAVITQLLVYPVKSCAGVSVQQARLTDTGLDFDRHWMVVDAQGEFLTQRELPRMVLIQPQLRTYEMVLTAPGMLALHVALDAVEDAVTVRLWGESAAAFDMGAVAAQWFSDFLGTSARLVRFDPDHRRVSDRAWTDGDDAFNQFNDGFALLVIGQPSLDDLNARLAARGEAPVTMARFRPNIVLGSGVSAQAPQLLAHDEDRWGVLTIHTGQAAAALRLVKPCPRCPIPNIDPITGVSTPAVGDVLQGYRWDARLGGAVTFGMNAIIVPGVPGVGIDAIGPLLKVGQRVSADYVF
jgi:uncharacterized protein